MNDMVKTNGIILVFLGLLFFPPQLSAQSEFLPQGINGTVISVNSLWKTSEFDSVGFRAGYSIGGILDLGMGLSLEFDELGSYGAREINGYIFYNVSVLKQGEFMPLSLQVLGSYGLIHVSSEYLDERDLIKRGSGFTVGARLLREFMLGPVFGIRLGLFTTFSSYRFTMETETSPPENSEYPLSSTRQNLDYGIILGVVFKASPGPVIAANFEGMMDQDFHLQFGPVLSVAYPLGHL